MSINKTARKALIVDDVWDMRQLLREILESEGVVVFDSETGKSAMRLLEQNPDITLALVDQNLPDVSGTELMGQLKSIRSDLQIIVISGVRDRDVVLRSLKAGAHDYVVKPIDPLVLITKIRAVRPAVSPPRLAIASVDVPVHVSGSPAASLRCVMLSETRISVTSNSAIVAGTVLSLEFQACTHLSKSFAAAAKVASCSQVKGKHELDMEFVDLADDAKAIIRSAIVRRAS